MAREVAPIDITNIPELIRLAEEVRATGEPRLLRKGEEDLARITPVAPLAKRRAAGREFTTKDSLFKIVGVAAGSADRPTDVSAPRQEVNTMAAERAPYQDRIIQDPNIMVGKPVVRGTRIPVELVLAKLAHSPDLGELFTDYPRLTLEDVRACLDYAKTLVEKKRKARVDRPGRVPHPTL